MSLVSIVLLNWNGKEHVYRCLEHVANQHFDTLEVIVVDNGSTDDSLSRIKAKYPRFTFIENRANVGFAAGMNQGIGASRGDFVVPLNQDVCLHADFLRECVAAMKWDPTLGAIGGRVFSWIGSDLTSQPRRGEGEHSAMRKRFQMDGGNASSKPRLTFAPAGSFPFLRRSMLEDIRTTSGYYYDEAFGTGWEDCDMWFRMHLRGWKCLFLPSAIGWHVGSGSVGGKSTFLSKDLDYQVRILRNRYFTIVKNLPLRTAFWLLPYVGTTEIALIPYFLIYSPKSLFALVVAWCHVLKRAPTLMRERTLIQGSKKVGHVYLKQYFERF